MLFVFLITLLILFIFLVLLPLYLFLRNNTYLTVPTLIIKGLAAALVFFISVFGMIIISKDSKNLNLPNELKNNWWVVIGLFTCFVANIVIDIHFIIGELIYLLGHLFYLIFLLTLAPFHTISIPIYVILLMSSLCYFYPYLVFLKKEKFFYYIYGALIAANASLGVLLPLNLGVYGLFIALAMVLLAISDILVTRNKLEESTEFSEILALSFYYSGQISLALSIFLPTIIK